MAPRRLQLQHSLYFGGLERVSPGLHGAITGDTVRGRDAALKLIWRRVIT